MSGMYFIAPEDEELRRRVRQRCSSVTRLFAVRVLQIRVGHLSRPAEHMRVIRFVSVKRAGAADRNRAGVTENLPLPLRRLYRERRTSAIYTSWPSTRRPSTRSKASAWKLMFPVICPPPESAGKRCLAAGTALQGAHHVLARDDARKPLIAIDHRHAADAMVDHQLKHPGQPGIRPDIDEFRRS